MLVAWSPLAAAGSGKIALHKLLTSEMNQMLKAADGMHRAFLGQDEDQIEIAIRDVIVQIDRVRTVSVVAKQHERYHLLRILEAAREHLEQSQSSYGQFRVQGLAAAFNQLVNIVRIYKLSPTYSIFFCSQDRQSWIQSGSKGQNPFSTSIAGRKCGARVAK